MNGRIYKLPSTANDMKVLMNFNLIQEQNGLFPEATAKFDAIEAAYEKYNKHIVELKELQDKITSFFYDNFLKEEKNVIIFGSNFQFTPKKIEWKRTDGINIFSMSSAFLLGGNSGHVWTTTLAHRVSQTYKSGNSDISIQEKYTLNRQKMQKEILGINFNPARFDVSLDSDVKDKGVKLFSKIYKKQAKLNDLLEIVVFEMERVNFEIDAIDRECTELKNDFTDYVSYIVGIAIRDYMAENGEIVFENKKISPHNEFRATITTLGETEVSQKYFYTQILEQIGENDVEVLIRMIKMDQYLKLERSETETA